MAFDVEVYLRTVNGPEAANEEGENFRTKRGDFVVVKPPGWPWGPGELNSSKHIICTIQNIPVRQPKWEDWESFAAFVTDDDAVIEDDPENPGQQRRRSRYRRAWWLKIANLPAPIRQQINDGNDVILTWQQLHNAEAIRHRRRTTRHIGQE